MIKAFRFRFQDLNLMLLKLSRYMNQPQTNGLIIAGGKAMFKCHVCGSTESHVEQVSEVLKIQGNFYLVENIPATVCSRCGEETFSRETTERVRVMLHQGDKPIRSLALDVFSFDEAV
ncbi:YgiT-type zinc finger protein [Roseofilum capinflatum]